jgi:hypothetical protein
MHAWKFRMNILKGMPIVATLIYLGIQYPYIPGKLPPEDQVNAHPLTHQRTQQKTPGPASLLRRAPVLPHGSKPVDTQDLPPCQGRFTWPRACGHSWLTSLPRRGPVMPRGPMPKPLRTSLPVEVGSSAFAYMALYLWSLRTPSPQVDELQCRHVAPCQSHSGPASLLRRTPLPPHGLIPVTA